MTILPRPAFRTPSALGSISVVASAGSLALDGAQQGIFSRTGVKRIPGNKRILQSILPQTKGGHVYYYYHNLLKNGQEVDDEGEMEKKRPQEIASAPAFLSARNER